MIYIPLFFTILYIIYVLSIATRRIPLPLPRHMVRATLPQPSPVARVTLPLPLPVARAAPTLPLPHAGYTLPIYQPSCIVALVLFD